MRTATYLLGLPEKNIMQLRTRNGEKTSGKKIMAIGTVKPPKKIN
jgi:hypothetical protein